jgi:hypothetical protein
LFDTAYPDKSLDDLLIMPSPTKRGDLEKVEGQYTWPFLKDCKNKFLLSLHKKYHRRISNPEHRKYFFIDDSGCMSNINHILLHRPFWGWRRKQKVRSKIKANGIVRIYPSPKEQSIESSYFKSSAELGAQLIAVDYEKRGESEFHFGMESKTIEYSD